MIPRWLIWTLVALCSWGIWAILSKLIGSALSPAHGQAVSTLGLLPVVAALACMREPSSASRSSWGIGLALAAGAVSCLGNIPYYSVLSSGAKAATIVPLTALYPLVTVLLAVPLLKERLNPIQMSGIALSLVAIYLFNVRNEQHLLSAGLLTVLLTVVLWGLAGLLQKLATNHVSGNRAALWFLLAFVPVALLIVLEQPLPAGISARTWTVTLLLGFALGLGNYAILVAYASNGKASVITPLAGLYPLVSIPLAIVFLGERINGRESLGIALALAAVITLSYEGQPATILTRHHSRHGSP